MRKVIYRAEFFKERDLYVGLVPELNVSSFGTSLDEARGSLQEAVEAFIEKCEAMGTLEQVMEESGFMPKKGTLVSREPIAAELLSVGCEVTELLHIRGTLHSLRLGI